ncbi:hypothetical protein BKA70DRAFT_827471 [Coprinopsis sp. MPI-PUGE-AT-0042]|nr:hypothetical protein BKA70DRAFT_827471 [Coprinopsis sp. MPI-PUGE-AT-0042]
MADNASIRASVISRSPSFLNRPNQAPMGPRTRVRSSHIPNAAEGTTPGLRPLSPLSQAAGVTILKQRPFSTNPGGPSITLSPSPASHIPEFGSPLSSADIVSQLDAITEGAGDSAQPSPVEPGQEAEVYLPLPPLPASPTSTLDGSRLDDVHWQSGSSLKSQDSEDEGDVEGPLTSPEVEEDIAEDVTVKKPVVEQPVVQQPPPQVPVPEEPLPEPRSRSATPEEEPVSDEERREEDDYPAVQTALPPPPSSHTARLTPEPQPPTAPMATKPISAMNPPKLAPPHPIKFESSQVQWKGLPLEAAVWTFDSKELQAIVSRAIRSSARESYIRLLAIDILDNVLPEEVERLESHKAMTQAKYRFLVHRRTMQLQALLSSTLAPRGPKDTEDSILTATKLVVQISETTAECDKLMEELLKVTDQLGQIKRLLDHHWASALAIALRKLNGSYARRTVELSTARERVTQLEAELQDAWAEAEKLAREMDDLDAALSDEDEAIIETAEVVSLHPESRPMSPAILTSPISPSHSRSMSFPMSFPQEDEPQQRQQQQPTPPDTRGNSQIMSIQTTQLPPISPLSPLLIKTAVPKRHSDLGNGNIEIPPADVPDSVSIKSSKSGKSYKSSSKDKDNANTRASVVSAARKRSLRISQSSLRLPPGFGGGPGSAGGHKRNGSRPRTPYTTEDQPPVPELPLRFASPFRSSHSSNPSSTLMHFDSGFDNPLAMPLSPNRRSTRSRRTSFDSARVTAGHRTPLPWSGGVTVDDMYITPSSRRNDSDSDEIEVVPRTPPVVPPKMMSVTMSEEEPVARPRPVKARKGGVGIPSIWMNVDAPKTPAERVDSLMRSGSTVKGTTYQRLRGLTKRYSLPFPLFRTGSSSQQSHTTS